MKEPFISVIVTAYNRKEYLREALQSVADQDLPKEEFETFVVMNFEDREIEEMCHRLNAEIIHTVERNVALFRYEAIDRARGQVLVFLDDDDRWESRKLSHVFELFSSDRNLGFYRNSIRFINHDGVEIDNPYRYRPIQYREKGSRLYIPGKVLEGYSEHIINRRYDFNCSSISIRKDILALNRESARGIQSSFDSFMFYCTVMSGYSFLVDNSVLTYYRINGNSISFTPTLDFSARQIVTYGTMQAMAVRHGKMVLLRLIERQIAFFELINAIHKSDVKKKEVISLAVLFSRYLRIYKIVENTVTEIISLVYVIHPPLGRSLYAKFTSVSSSVLP